MPLNTFTAQPSLGLETVDPGETFIGVCPECNSQLELAEGLDEVPRLRLQRVRVR